MTVRLESVDRLQRTLASTVFGYAADQKKAAGRAMGTIVEIVTYYALLAGDLQNNVVIERAVPEFGNPSLLHNVEFSLHPVLSRHDVSISPTSLPITSKKISSALPNRVERELKSNTALDRQLIKRNATVLANDETGTLVANVSAYTPDSTLLTVCELGPDPYAIIECKRVGVEEGMRKGPQTIEKAKQGAYVARSVSSLQKFRSRNGQVQGVVEMANGQVRVGSYNQLLQEVLSTASAAEFPGFMLTIGVVSNHGNWFTSDNQNKELRVLAQSYDWLLFLTDRGLARFIDSVLLNPTSDLEPAQRAFRESYTGTAGANIFTKVRMALEADGALRNYFAMNSDEVSQWFNVISPNGWSLAELQASLHTLAARNYTRSRIRSEHA